MACVGHGPAQSKGVVAMRPGTDSASIVSFYHKEVASMKRIRILWPGSFRNIRQKASALTFLFLALPVQAQHDPKLQQIAAFPDQQVTGITVAADGRIFVNFPYWSNAHPVSVAQLGENSALTPYPDSNWNSNEGPVDRRFVCVQSVVADDQGALWVLDPASVKMEGVVSGGAKLVKIDLKTNKVIQDIVFPDSVAPKKSYLNDVRIDTRNGFAFITDSGIGGLVVVDLKSGQARRVLQNHPSTKAEPAVALVIEGVKLVDPKTGEPVQVHSDGIAYDKAGGVIYYQALAGRTLYRIPVPDLENVNLPDADLAKLIETVATVPAADGLAFRNGSIYSTAIEQNAIVRIDLASKLLEVVTKDSRLKWPDTLSFGPDGSLYATNSQIHLTARFNHGVSKISEPFGVYRIPLAPEDSH
jgi:sugar lactone lactonase YvrE